MRKLSLVFLGVLASMLLFMIPNNKVSADDNNTIFNAVEFTSENPATDELESESDIDWFKYTVNSRGTVCFSLTNLSDKSGRWNITIFDENGQNMVWDTTSYSSAAATVSPLYSFENGTVLTFRIKDYSGTKGLSYQLSVMIDELWEDSHNSSYGKKNIMGSHI